MKTKAILEYFTRPLKCEACFGYNRRTCEDCLGRGQENNVLDGEEKTTSCSTCNGKGYVGCAACDGTGLKNGWLFTVKGGWGPRGECDRSMMSSFVGVVHLMGRDDDDDDVKRQKYKRVQQRQSGVESASSRDTSRGDESTAKSNPKPPFRSSAEKSQPKFSTKSLRTLRKS